MECVRPAGGSCARVWNAHIRPPALRMSTCSFVVGYRAMLMLRCYIVQPLLANNAMGAGTKLSYCDPAGQGVWKMTMFDVHGSDGAGSHATGRYTLTARPASSIHCQLSEG